MWYELLNDTLHSMIFCIKYLEGSNTDFNSAHSQTKMYRAQDCNHKCQPACLYKQWQNLTYIFLRLGSFLNIPVASRTEMSLSCKRLMQNNNKHMFFLKKVLQIPKLRSGMLTFDTHINNRSNHLSIHGSDIFLLLTWTEEDQNFQCSDVWN